MILVLANSSSPGNVSQVSLTVPRDLWLVGVDWSMVGIAGTGHMQAALARTDLVNVPSDTTTNANTIISHMSGFAPGANNKFVQLPPEKIPAGTVMTMNLFIAATATGNYCCAALHFSENDPGPRGQEIPKISLAALPVVAARPTAAEANLKTKVVRADRAVACCRRGSLTVLRDVGLVLRDSFDIVQGLTKDQVVVSVGGILGTAPSLVRDSRGVITEFEQLLSRPVSAGGAGSASDFQRLIGRNINTSRPLPKGGIGPGQVAVLLGVTAAGFLIDAAAKTAALETLSMVSGAITSIRERGDCVTCITQSLLSQAAPRQNMLVKIRRRA